MKGKIFWTMVAAEVVVAGVIGWKIANAKLHPWAVKTRLPPPRRKPSR